MDEKIFTVAAPSNSQNDRLYAPVAVRKKDVDELRERIVEEWDKLDQRIIDNELDSGERDFERVWLQMEDSLNTRCEFFQFLTFSILNCQTHLFEKLLITGYFVD